MNIKEFKEALKINKRIEAVSITQLEREPIHPGVILEEEFMKLLGLSQSKLARELGVSVRAVNEIVNKKRGITPEMAIRLSERFGTTAEFWLRLQMDYDLWKAYNKPSRKFKKKKTATV
jgi:addiction module HigA family antidote